ncbi:MAG: acetyl-CoA acetyltransferase [Myxococcota bacterium]
MGSVKDRVAVVGAACTKFGDRTDASYEALVVEAAKAALADAGVGPDRIDACWLGTYSPGAQSGKSGTSLADPLRLYGKPISRVENYCATGTDAVRQAVFALASGVYDVALVVGAEKMKDRPVRGIPLEGRHPILGRGATAPGQFALAANRYMHTFGVGRETLAKVAVKNHANGAKNPLAHMQVEVTEEQVLSAPIVAWPFGLYDCCPTTDGAAAVVLARAEIADSLKQGAPRVKGVGLAVTSGRPFNDPGFAYLGFPATQQAAAQAYAMAGVQNPVREIDFAEVHDCFTWTELTNYEDLGFCEKGRGRHLIEEGRTRIGGDKPVNPSGGLKSFGHPIGASGVRMVYEVAQQLRGEAGPRQVANARLGLAHNVGGPGAVSCVIVLGAA